MARRDDRSGDGGAPALGPNEVLVWEGRPDRGFKTEDVRWSSLVGTMAAVVGLLELLQGRWVLGLALLVTGGWFGIGRLLFDALARRATTYRLTMNRAYIVRTWPRRRVVTVDLGRIGPSTLRQWRDGTDSILFGRPSKAVSRREDRRKHPEFRYIHDGERLMPYIRGLVDLDDVVESGPA